MKAKLALAAALLALAGCATQEEPQPAPQPAPAPAPAAEPAPAPAAPPPAAEPAKPVIEKVRLESQALFDFDRATLRPDGRAALDDVAQKARAISLENLIVTGHADRIGSTAYNQRLSLRRAEAVKAYFASKGFDAARLYSEGKGESQPVTGNQCRKMGPENGRNKKLVACLQPDRRVEVEIIGTRTR